MASRPRRSASGAKFSSTACTQAGGGTDSQALAIALGCADDDQTRLAQTALTPDRHRARRSRPSGHGAARDDAKTSDELEYLEIPLADPVGSLSSWHLYLLR